MVDFDHVTLIRFFHFTIVHFSTIRNVLLHAGREIVLCTIARLAFTKLNQLKCCNDESRARNNFEICPVKVPGKMQFDQKFPNVVRNFLYSCTSTTFPNEKLLRHVVNHCACNNKTQMFNYSKQNRKKMSNKGLDRKTFIVKQLRLKH